MSAPVLRGCPATAASTWVSSPASCACGSTTASTSGGIKGDTGATGPIGPAGANGVNGVNAYTTTLADFVQPAVSGSVTIAVANSTWLAVGLTVFVEVGGYYTITNIPTTTSVIVVNSGASGNAAPGATVSSGSKMVSGGMPGASSVFSIGTTAQRNAYVPATSYYLWMLTDSDPPYQFSIWDGATWS